MLVKEKIEELKPEIKKFSSYSSQYLDSQKYKAIEKMLEDKQLELELKK